jgi:seryl-tRNA synthetase
MTVIIKRSKNESDIQPADPIDSVVATLFRPMGVDGVYARTAPYEELVEHLSKVISRHRDPAAEILRFPPVMSRHQLEKSGYLKSFPNLLGCVCALHGTEGDILAAAGQHEAGGDWTASLSPADLVLVPAACYPVYPLAASRGAVPSGGLRFDVASECFRHEPSRRIDRLQSFRMREYVCIGSAHEVTEFRDRWIERGRLLASELGLTYKVVPASDPFFGRTGQMMAVNQIQQSLKYELLLPVGTADPATACMSFNYHLDHFGSIWGIQDESNAIAHTGCVAFGMDRLAVALFWKHGLNVKKWPAAVRRSLSF